jgi:hypothetical protein
MKPEPDTQEFRQFSNFIMAFVVVLHSEINEKSKAVSSVLFPWIPQ